LTKDEKAKKLAVYQNRVGQVNLEWDPDVLKGLAEEGVDLSNLWREDELDALLERVPDVEFEEYDESAVDNVKMCICPECGHEFPA